MSLPTSMPLGTIRTPTGVQLQIHPSTEGRFSVELRRSTQSSTSSTAWFTQQFDPSSGAFKVSVPIPLSTRSYYWQARHVGVGYSAGAYSPVVSAKPVKLSLGGNVPVVRGKNAAVEIPLGDVWLTSAKTMKVGTQATTATITKRARFDKSGFGGESSTTLHRTFLGYMHPNSTNIQILDCPVTLQPGVTLERIAVRGNRQSTAGIITLALQRSSANGATVITLATVQLTSAGFQTKESSTIPASSAIYSTAFSYYLRTGLKNGSGSTAAQSRFMWGEVVYGMPSYDKAV